MQPIDALAAPSFVSCSEILIPAMQRYLLSDSQNKIFISKSLSINKSLVVLNDEADSGCLTLDEFLVAADARMEKEIPYKKELSQLKETICEEFHALCDDSSTELYIDFIEEQTQNMIGGIFDSSKIDEKMIAENFFNDMMNGFEGEALALNNFKKTADTILWKSLSAPFLIEALNNIREFLKSTELEKPIEKIKKIVSQLIIHIKPHMKVQQLADTNFDTSDRLKSTLIGLASKRKTCNIELRKIHENERIIEELQGKCIENVTIITDVTTFLGNAVKIDCEELYLNRIIDEKDVKKLFNKIHRKLFSMRIELGNKNFEHYEVMGKNLSKLKTQNALMLVSCNLYCIIILLFRQNKTEKKERNLCQLHQKSQKIFQLQI